MKIAVCDDDKLLTGEIDGQLQRIQQKWAFPLKQISF